MNRKSLLSLILLCAGVMIFALVLIVMRYRSLTSSDIRPPVQTAAKTSGAAAMKAAPAKKPAEQMKNTAAKTRNIGFSFKNSKVKKVEIIGTFNNWIPMAMEKGANHTWKINLALAPGEYAYNFVVDGRPARDPFNQKTCNVGRGFTNSYLKVEPLR